MDKELEKVLKELKKHLDELNQALLDRFKQEEIEVVVNGN
jgi:hypothetical protein